VAEVIDAVREVDARLETIDNLTGGARDIRRRWADNKFQQLQDELESQAKRIHRAVEEIHEIRKKVV